MKKEVLITGGAGYIGTTLIPHLLVEGYNVTIYDSLSYEGDVLIPYFANPNFKFIKGDILDKDKLQKAIKGKDVIIHLAALVGYAACEKNHDMTQLVNCDATDSLVEMLSPNQLLLFGSTGSNYGKVTNGVCTEETPLNPTSLYAETKTYAEKKAMSHGNTIAYRFATAFGSSPRLRLDLLVNELTYLAVTQGYIMVYQPEFMRTFIHVRDLVKSFMFGIKNADKMAGEVYNVGSNKMNYSKRDVCEMIKAKTGCVVTYNDFDSDKDHRDYVVSYDKINTLGFDTTSTLEEGIDELIKVYEVLNLKDKRHVNAGA
jgi:nucleoside-diphosphate-sugar epimerase